MLRISDTKEIEELKYRNKIILLHFITQWCPPCKLSKKLLQSELAQLSNLIVFSQINCDEAQQLVLDYKIQGVPTIIMLDKNLKVIQKLIGYFPQKVKAMIKKVKKVEN